VVALQRLRDLSFAVYADRPTSTRAARNLYLYYKADIYAYVMVLQNINRELCRRLRCADSRIAELADVHASQSRRFAYVLWVEKKLRPCEMEVQWLSFAPRKA
jgi:hypothetical protein